jgi:hypothetical protein
MSEFQHVSYLSLQGTLKTSDDEYKHDWDDELHPRRRRGHGFYKIAERFAEAIENIQQ